MSKPITIILNRPRNLQAALAHAKAEALKHQISFEGTESQGYGSGHGFAAKYIVYPDYIELTVVDKPFWAPASKVEEKIKKYYLEYLQQKR